MPVRHCAFGVTSIAGLVLALALPNFAHAADPPAQGDILFAGVSGPIGLGDYSPSVGTTRAFSALNALSVAVESPTSVFISTLGGIVYRVNLTTGSLTPLSSGGYFSTNIDGITLGRTGDLYVSDLLDNQIIAVNTVTGAQRLVTGGGLLNRPIFMVPVGQDSLLVSSDAVNRLVWVRISDGAQTLAASGGNLMKPEGIAIDFDGRAIVVDLDARKLIAINLTTGVQQVIASSLAGTPLGLALDGLGNAYVGNYESSTSGFTKINLLTGARTVITTPTMFPFGMVLFNPGAAIGPPPASPATFTASDNLPDGVQLAWSAVSEAVVYRIYRDGQPLVMLPAPATSYLDNATLGTYTYCIEAINQGGASPQVCDEGSRRAYRTNPEIRIVRDVPNDQGGKLALAWLRSEYDSPINGTVTGYRIWRRLPFSEGARAGDSGAPQARAIQARAIETAQGVTFWEPLMTLPSAFLEGYGAVVATTQDSLADANAYTAFFVSAVTADPRVFYDSAVDSGYSVDNLAPAEPAGLHGTIAQGSGVTLHWLPNHEADLARYNVYRGPSDDFALTEGSRIGSTADTVFVDPSSPGAFYKLAALDIHGNESPAATLAPADVPTLTLVSNIEGHVEGNRVRVTVSLASSALRLSALLYRGSTNAFPDASPLPVVSTEESDGRIDLWDDSGVAGIRYWYWVQLVNADGAVVLAGPVAITLGSAPEFTALRAPEPNPTASGVTTLRFAVGTDAAGAGLATCRIDIFNVQGRRVRALESSARLAGTYESVWDGRDDAGEPVRSGVYYVRFAAGTRLTSCKLVVSR